MLEMYQRGVYLWKLQDGGEYRAIRNQLDDDKFFFFLLTHEEKVEFRIPPKEMVDAIKAETGKEKIFMVFDLDQELKYENHSANTC